MSRKRFKPEQIFGMLREAGPRSSVSSKLGATPPRACKLPTKCQLSVAASAQVCRLSHMA